jgi:hypothetical protein
MKRLFLSFLAVLFSTCFIFACPFCGCGNSNFQVGILPTYSNAFVGVRYTYTHFNTLSHDGTQFSHDYFHITELWGGYKIGKVQVMAFLPYVTSHKSNDDGIINENGIGDVLILTNYQIFSNTHANSKTEKPFSNTLWLGGGIKFHTGQSQADTGDPDFTVGDFSSTPGTGSTDYLLNATHNLIMGNSGIATDIAYRINTANPQQFQYGNRIYINTAYFHSWIIGQVEIRPSIGLNLVANETNHYQDQAIADSHGYVLSGKAGINLQRGMIGLVVDGVLPLAQNLFDRQTRFQSRASTSLTFSF